MQNDLIKNLLYDKSNPLIFTSGLFLIVFTVFLFLYSIIYSRKTIRNIYVVAFSLFFYYKTSGDFVIVLFGFIIVNFVFALLLHNIDFNNLRRFAFILGLFSNIFALAYFKYINFLIDNFNFLINGNLNKIDLIFPIGISFYTFQSISYLTDVFRKNIKPTNNFLDYTFYVSFFPYIVAGPITRASDMLPQINSKFNINKDDISFGFALICKGLIKKGILAYYVSQYCDLIYGAPSNFSGLENIIAMISYSLEIYLDFSGYSDLAIGISRLMGFKIKQNFESPYKAKNIIEFWKRWHISLSTWLRDYLFLPLNYFYLRYASKKKYSLLISYIFATAITMIIAGLWHGTSNKYIIWGALHGFGLVINRLYLFFVSKKIQKIVIIRIFGRIITILFILITWVLFRASNIDESIDSLSSMVFNFDYNYLIPFFNARSLFVFIFILSFVLVFLPDIIKGKIFKIFSFLPIWCKAVIFILILQVIIQIQTESVQPFIYYQF